MHILSTLFFSAFLALALGVIVAMIRGRMERILEALAGPVQGDARAPLGNQFMVRSMPLVAANDRDQPVRLVTMAA